MFKYIWITSVLNGPCFLSIKLSLLFFYRRIFLVNQHWLRIFWWINLVYAVLWFFGSTLDFVFQCVPVSFYWERSYLRFPDAPPSVHGECHASANWQVAMPIIFSVISDFALLGLPVASLMGLNMSKKQKTALIAIFSVGLFAGEGAAIICACLPLIAAQLKYLFEKIGVYWHSRLGNKSNRLTRLTNHPIRLSSRRNSEEKSHKRKNEYSSKEQLHTGTSTTIEPSSDRESGVAGENQIRVKTDLEWVAGEVRR
ncbi:MAG: hypothetical protein Q9161_002082 [Pseudevernia consocians]